MRMDQAFRRTVLAVTTVVVLAAATAACSSPAGPAATTTGFVGYKWAVASIAHDGRTIPVPARYSVYLQFTPDGHFGANEPVNHHSGTYRVTPEGFTVSDIATTLAGYAGRDPVVLLSRSAISAFTDDVRARANVNGGAMTVTAGSYTFTAERDGRQANF
jgi:hypothetical protein